jgi:hypothetical protein
MTTPDTKRHIARLSRRVRRWEQLARAATNPEMREARESTARVTQASLDWWRNHRKEI